MKRDYMSQGVTEKLINDVVMKIKISKNRKDVWKRISILKCERIKVCGP